MKTIALPTKRMEENFKILREREIEEKSLTRLKLSLRNKEGKKELRCGRSVSILK